MSRTSPDDLSYWMVIPASASIGTLASGYKEDNCIYVGIGILVARCVRMQDLSTYRDTSSMLIRRILRQGVSIGIPTGIHEGY